MLRVFSLFSSVPPEKPEVLFYIQTLCILPCFSNKSISLGTTQRVTSSITECHDKLTVIVLSVSRLDRASNPVSPVHTCIQFVEGTRCILILSLHVAWVGTCLLFA